MKKLLIISLLAIMSLSFSIGAYAKVNFDTDDTSMYNEIFISDGTHTRYYVDGNYVIGMQSIKDRAYYFDENGFKTIGWKNINNSWYYFDLTGAMKTGWIEDINGKWYYLNADGTMATNTTIDGYNLGSDGAWIK